MSRCCRQSRDRRGTAVVWRSGTPGTGWAQKRRRRGRRGARSRGKRGPARCSVRRPVGRSTLARRRTCSIVVASHWCCPASASRAHREPSFLCPASASARAPGIAPAQRAALARAPARRRAAAAIASAWAPAWLLPVPRGCAAARGAVVRRGGGGPQRGSGEAAEGGSYGAQGLQNPRDDRAGADWAIRHTPYVQGRPATNKVRSRGAHRFHCPAAVLHPPRALCSWAVTPLTVPRRPFVQIGPT
jgi:hypothetical protein